MTASLDAFAAAKLAELDARSLRRTLVPSAREEGIHLTRGGRRLMSFCCNDYLNLAQHAVTRRAAVEATQRWGVGAGASRLVTGNHPLYQELETRLAAFKGAEAACVFGSGYLANTGIVPVLCGPADLVLLDELAHACLWAGARLSGATVIAFPHNDLDALAGLLATRRAKYRHCLIATDGVFSMDGDLAPLPAMAALAQAHDAWLMTDDAHGLGVLGGGRGSSFAFGEKVAVPLQMGTLSKAVGGYGAYLCASRAVVELVRNRARTLIYSTGLPPATVAAATAALDFIAREPAYAALPVQKARLFTRRAGLPEAQSPIVPVVLGDAAAALDASRLLEEEGFLVTAIRPPTVPEGTARLRITFTAAHPDGEVVRLADLVRALVLPMASAASRAA
ncbi:MAG TPA: 8-amino-7-oxononanoate synthase [Azospirillaceae bacterium]|nr:8-amino-7-oxononanoate synthase [Azospirillaceae bacterium]